MTFKPFIWRLKTSPPQIALGMMIYSSPKLVSHCVCAVRTTYINRSDFVNRNALHSFQISVTKIFMTKEKDGSENIPPNVNTELKIC